MRLTEKGKRIYPVPRRMSGKPHLDAENEFKCLIYNKLSELEDIEEELGIDLVTLIKVLKNGCYVKPWKKIKRSYEIRTGSNNDHLFLLDEHYNDYSLEDYGKTWALTEEELK